MQKITEINHSGVAETGQIIEQQLVLEQLS
jgi:hypothetical protein